MVPPGRDLGNMQLVPAAVGKHVARHRCHDNNAVRVALHPALQIDVWDMAWLWVRTFACSLSGQH